MPGKGNIKYDIIIAGAGIAGLTAARILAEKGKNVLVIEKKNHIGGNCYDENEGHGILIHVYGPHIFHTGNEKVFKFLSRFTKWRLFRHEVVANVHGTYMPVPFNLLSLKAAYGEEKGAELEEKLAGAYGMGSRVPVLKLMEQDDEDLRMIGKYVYDNIYVYYTMKQWGKKPEDIDPSVTARVPVSVSYDSGYFEDPYQGVPEDGFTAMFGKMADHENITLMTGTGASEVLAIRDGVIYYEGDPFCGKVIFTGPVDEFFGCKYGRLPYRTLDFEFEYHEEDDFQGHAVVNYTVDKAYTRITEYKHLTGQKCGGTVISMEYPREYTGERGQVPYYPIANEENFSLYDRYKKEADSVKGFILLGRLAEYQYYNMDVIVEKAMELAGRL